MSRRRSPASTQTHCQWHFANWLLYRVNTTFSCFKMHRDLITLLPACEGGLWSYFEINFIRSNNTTQRHEVFSPGSNPHRSVLVSRQGSSSVKGVLHSASNIHVFRSSLTGHKPVDLIPKDKNKFLTKSSLQPNISLRKTDLSSTQFRYAECLSLLILREYPVQSQLCPRHPYTAANSHKLRGHWMLIQIKRDINIMSSSFWKRTFRFC
jgi:hypothetical protein